MWFLINILLQQQQKIGENFPTPTWQRNEWFCKPDYLKFRALNSRETKTPTVKVISYLLDWYWCLIYEIGIFIFVCNMFSWNIQTIKWADVGCHSHKLCAMSLFHFHAATAWQDTVRSIWSLVFMYFEFKKPFKHRRDNTTLLQTDFAVEKTNRTFLLLHNIHFCRRLWRHKYTNTNQYK